MHILCFPLRRSTVLGPSISNESVPLRHLHLKSSMALADPRLVASQLCELPCRQHTSCGLYRRHQASYLLGSTSALDVSYLAELEHGSPGLPHDCRVVKRAKGQIRRFRMVSLDLLTHHVLACSPPIAILRRTSLAVSLCGATYMLALLLASPRFGPYKRSSLRL